MSEAWGEVVVTVRELEADYRRRGALELWLSAADGDLAHPLIRFGTPLDPPNDGWIYTLRGVSLD